MCENGSQHFPIQSTHWPPNGNYHTRVTEDTNNNLTYGYGSQRDENNLDEYFPAPEVSGLHRNPLPRSSNWNFFGNQSNNTNGESRVHSTISGQKFSTGSTVCGGFNRGLESFQNQNDGDVILNGPTRIQGQGSFDSGSKHRYVLSQAISKAFVGSKSLRNEWYQASSYSGGTCRRLEAYPFEKNYENDRTKNRWSISNSGLTTILSNSPVEKSKHAGNVDFVSEDSTLIGQCSKNLQCAEPKSTDNPESRNILRSLLTKNRDDHEESSTDKNTSGLFNEKKHSSTSAIELKCLPLIFNSEDSEPIQKNFHFCEESTINYAKNGVEGNWKSLSNNGTTESIGINLTTMRVGNKRVNDTECCWEPLRGKMRRMSEVDLLKKECVLRNGKTICFEN